MSENKTNSSVAEEFKVTERPQLECYQLDDYTWDSYAYERDLEQYCNFLESKLKEK